MKCYLANKELTIYVLNKDDIDLLINKIKESFSTSNSLNVDISTSVKNVRIKESNTNSFWTHPEVSSAFNYLYIEIDDFKNDKHVRLSFFPSSTTLNIDGMDEDWVNGVEKKIIDFLSSRKHYLGFMSNSVRGILGGAFFTLAFWSLYALVYSMFYHATYYWINLLPWFLLVLFGLISYVLIYSNNKFYFDKNNRWSRSDKIALTGIILSVVIPFVFFIIQR